MFSKDEMRRAIEDALKSMEGVALELYRRGREESREELEAVKRERDQARDKYEALAVLVDGYRRERDEARGQRARMAEQIATLDRNAETFIKDARRMRRERDEAQARVVDAALIHADLVRERDDARAQRDAAIARITEVGVMVATNGNELAKDAYRRGAEAMREACAMLVLTSNAVHGRVDADALRDLPIPEEP